MNTATTILIPFQQYYFFTSDCGKTCQGKDDAATIACSLARCSRHGKTPSDDSARPLFFERATSPANQKNCVPMVIGTERTSLESLKKKQGQRQQDLACGRALIKEYAAMDILHRARTS
jgi:hypothetical protein